MKKNYVGIGLVMGAGLGVAFGTVFGSVGLGIPIGAGIGLIFGVIFAARRKRNDTIA